MSNTSFQRTVRQATTRVANIDHRGRVLSVICSGEFGIGSDGNPSAELVRESIEQWIADHPDQVVAQIDLDDTKVDYSWGDGPISSVIPFIRHGVSKIRIIASRRNYEALEGLVATSGLQLLVEVIDGQKA